MVFGAQFENEINKRLATSQNISVRAVDIRLAMGRAGAQAERNKEMRLENQVAMDRVKDAAQRPGTLDLCIMILLFIWDLLLFIWPPTCFVQHLLLIFCDHRPLFLSETGQEYFDTPDIMVHILSPPDPFPPSHRSLPLACRKC